MFRDRRDAGKKLAALLSRYRGKDSVVLAIPRGGVIIADEVCESLNVKIGLLMTKKIGAPSDQEAAIGAVSEDGSTVLDRELINDFSIPDRYIQKEKARQLKEIKRRLKKYLADKLDPEIGEKTVIIVDDGIATGLTTLCAIRYIRSLGPEKIIVATPVAPGDVVRQLENEADEVVVAETPAPFYAIGHFYGDFEQVSDREVLSIIRKYIKE